MSVEGLSSIRENSRDQILRQRRENRLRAFALKREGIDKVADSFCSPNDISTMAVTLKHKSQVTRETLSKLSQGLAVSVEHAQAFLAVEGSVHSLSTYLTGGDAALQLEAAYCIANLALWNEEAKLTKHVLRQTSCYLVIFLGSPNPLLQQACTWAITNLLHDGFDTFTKLYFLPKLLSLAESPHDYVRRAVIECFVCLIATCYEKLQASELMEIAQTAVALTKKSTAVEVEPLAWLLFHLTTREVFHQALLESRMILWVLNCLVQHDTQLELRTPLVRCLGNLCALDEACIQIALDFNGFVEIFVRLLQCSPLSFVYREVAWALGNIVNVKDPLLQQRIRDLKLREATEKYLKPLEHLL